MGRNGIRGWWFRGVECFGEHVGVSVGVVVVGVGGVGDVGVRGEGVGVGVVRVARVGVIGGIDVGEGWAG